MKNHNQNKAESLSPTKKDVELLQAAKEAGITTADELEKFVYSRVLLKVLARTLKQR